MILKILRPSEWLEAQHADYFAGAPIDHEDGYIHFSTDAQVVETAARYFANEPVIHVLAIDLARLPEAELKWEPSRGGDLFPHLYGRLPMAAVSKVWHLEKAESGFNFGPILEDLHND
ncbi:MULTISPECIES: DUF952 domain-containing protein [Kordiimonas]|uniref:DUF952 domain-containing protein n=1 Tax=Kordiimonas TaxID=288021 RepID=UPI00257A9F53|nr:DUF952 domain-containing protein [Kordiimonas sp. UBA4487]